MVLNLDPEFRYLVAYEFPVRKGPVHTPVPSYISHPASGKHANDRFYPEPSDVFCAKGNHPDLVRKGVSFVNSYRG